MKRAHEMAGSTHAVALQIKSNVCVDDATLREGAAAAAWPGAPGAPAWRGKGGGLARGTTRGMEWNAWPGKGMAGQGQGQGRRPGQGQHACLLRGGRAGQGGTDLE